MLWVGLSGSPVFRFRWVSPGIPVFRFERFRAKRKSFDAREPKSQDWWVLPLGAFFRSGIPNGIRLSRVLYDTTHGNRLKTKIGQGK